MGRRDTFTVTSSSTEVTRHYVNIDDDEISVIYQIDGRIEEGKEGRYIAMISDVALEGMLHQLGWRKFD